MSVKHVGGSDQLSSGYGCIWVWSSEEKSKWRQRIGCIYMIVGALKKTK